MKYSVESHITFEIIKNKVNVEFMALKGSEMPGNKHKTIRDATVCFLEIHFNVYLKSRRICSPVLLAILF